ncbi:hypothetical protein ABK040_012246 [Willaertia magna]
MNAVGSPSPLSQIRSEMFNINSRVDQMMRSSSTNTIGEVRRELSMLYNDVIALKGRVAALLYQLSSSPFNANLVDVRDSCDALIAYLQHCNLTL